MPDSRVPLPGSAHKDLSPLEVESNEGFGSLTFDIDLLLRPRSGESPAEAAAKLDDVPLHERQYLTHDEVEARYGADPADVAKLQRFADEFGLKLIHAKLEERRVRVEGTVSAYGKAFRAQLREFRDEGGSFISHVEPLEVPSYLGGIVERVLGLHGKPAIEPDLYWRGASAHQRAATDPTGEVGNPDFSAPDVAQLYDFPASTGAGQVVGVIELAGGYQPKEIEQYFRHVGLSQKPTLVNVGPNVRAPRVLSNMEVTMNVQLVASVCPDATTVVYNAASKTYSLDDYYGVFSTAIHDRVNRPSVLSNSWSWSELFAQGTDLSHFDRLFAIASLLGITICGSAGNSGAQTLHFFEDRPAIVPSVRFPSSNPRVLACGGTSLFASGGEIRNEVVWDRLADHLRIVQTAGGRRDIANSHGMASTGGVSRMHGRPAYQDGADIPVLRHYAWHNGELRDIEEQAGRGVPDVAANADLETGYRFVFLDPPAAQGPEAGIELPEDGLVVGGGTSAATPMWAALVTRINEGLGRRVGTLQPSLYRLVVDQGTPVCRRITHGENGGYAAHPELVWNGCTGLGTPRGKALLAALRAMSSE
ncbi:MAG: S53 family peptidase [Myxococcota bacterium]